MTTAKVDPVRTLTVSLCLRAALATTLPWRTIFRPEILNRSSELVHESASCADLEVLAIVTLWDFVPPWASTSLNVFGADWHVSVVSISFITAWSALLSGQREVPSTCVARDLREARLIVRQRRPELNPTT